jgi:hypothetical protein
VHEFGEGEHFICRSLDGKTSLPEIRSAFQEHFGVAIGLDYLEAFVNDLGRAGLLEVEKGKRGASLSEAFFSQDPEKWASLKLFNPDNFLRFMSRRLGWCFTRSFVVASVFIVLLAAGVVYNNYYRFLMDLQSVFQPLSWLDILLVVYVFFNIPSQLVRGVTAVYFGGYANDFGIRLNYDIFPMFYCEKDITMIKEKSGRAWTLLSPAIYSLLMASFGIILWSVAPQGLVLHPMGITIFFVGLAYSLIRLNVLWPTDAPYLLANWLEIQDFRRRAVSFSRAWLFRLPLTEALTPRDKRLFLFYGILSAGVTLISIAIGGYYVGKWLTNTYSGTGVAVAVLMVMTKYRKILLAKI